MSNPGLDSSDPEVSSSEVLEADVNDRAVDDAFDFISLPPPMSPALSSDLSSSLHRQNSLESFEDDEVFYVYVDFTLRIRDKVDPSTRNELTLVVVDIFRRTTSKTTTTMTTVSL
jgi:hypothetical protein